MRQLQRAQLDEQFSFFCRLFLLEYKKETNKPNYFIYALRNKIGGREK